MTKESKIIAVVVFLVIVGAVIFGITQPAPTAPSAPVDNSLLVREGSHMTASKTAKVQIVEFGDYQCPACAAAFPITQKFLADYKNNPDVNFIFRNFPLAMHQNAQISAEAAEAAAAQGKFWEMHDMLYEKQGEWGEAPNPIDFFVTYAQNIGLDVAKFKTDIQNNQYSQIISADQKDGEKLGINGTPTFYINGVEFHGGSVPTYEDFKTKIDSLLK
jgi:protein-disulfide isomerase